MSGDSLHRRGFVHTDLAVSILCSSSLECHAHHTNVVCHFRYRGAIHKAALNEATAAGLLLMMGWDDLCSRIPHASLADPMCGSGTFLIEAAFIAERCKCYYVIVVFLYNALYFHDPKITFFVGVLLVSCVDHGHLSHGMTLTCSCGMKLWLLQQAWSGNSMVPYGDQIYMR